MAIRKPSIPVDRGDDWSEYNGVAMPEAEFLALDDAEETDLEYIDGVAWGKGMVDKNHRNLAGLLCALFWGYQEEHGGESGPEGRVRLRTGRYQKPDVAYWLPGIPSGNDTIPTLAVEIRSPDETMASQRRKCARYMESGVLVCWLIDPISRTVEVFEGEREGEPLAPDGVLTSEHLPGFEVAAADLFAVLDA